MNLRLFAQARRTIRELERSAVKNRATATSRRIRDWLDLGQLRIPLAAAYTLYFVVLAIRSASHPGDSSLLWLVMLGAGIAAATFLALQFRVPREHRTTLRLLLSFILAVGAAVAGTISGYDLGMGFVLWLALLGPALGVYFVHRVDQRESQHEQMERERAALRRHKALLGAIRNGRRHRVAGQRSRPG